MQGSQYENEAKWGANNKISLPQGQSYTEREYYKGS